MRQLRPVSFLFVSFVFVAIALDTILDEINAHSNPEETFQTVANAAAATTLLEDHPFLPRALCCCSFSFFLCTTSLLLFLFFSYFYSRLEPKNKYTSSAHSSAARMSIIYVRESCALASFQTLGTFFLLM